VPTIIWRGGFGRIDAETELGGDLDLVSEGLQRFSDQDFVRVGTVDLGGVEQGDAEFYRVV